MQKITRTVYNSYLNTCLLMGVPFQLVPNSTLNELFSVQQGVAPAATPHLKYFAIGIGGRILTAGADGTPLVEVQQHKATDAGVFRPVPFILRPITNDIDAGTRANYAMRRIETINNVDYVAYYLKRLPIQGVPVDMEYITVINGVQTISAFAPNSSNLNPTPQTLNNGGVNLVSGDLVAASAKMAASFTANEVAEFISAITIKFGDPTYANISEVALVSGEDKVVQSPAAGNTMINFTEAIAAQILTHFTADYNMQFNTNGLTINLDIGNTESLMAIG